MMRWLWLLPLALLLVLFALSNTEPVEVRLWPFDLAWVAPLALAVLLAAALAFLLGALIVWGASLPHRRRARQLQHAAELLRAELDSLKARQEARGALPAP
jgi:uncharacterized integral membrane protein